MTASVAKANQDMSTAWNGNEGDYWSENTDRYEGVNRELRPQFLAAASIGVGDRVLDIGCGAGKTTRAAAVLASSGRALGIDLSGQMLALAAERARAEGIDNAHFVQGDAQVYPFETGFDVAISQFGSMFFGDQVAAFANIARALKPSGRITLMSWQEMARTEWALGIRHALAAGRQMPDVAPAGPGPYAHADPDVVRAVLGDAGFVDVDVTGVEGTSYFGADADDAYGFVRGMPITASLLADLDAAAAAAALEELRAMLAVHETVDGVFFDSAAWLITARRG